MKVLGKIYFRGMNPSLGTVPSYSSKFPSLFATLLILLALSSWALLSCPMQLLLRWLKDQVPHLSTVKPALCLSYRTPVLLPTLVGIILTPTSS